MRGMKNISVSISDEMTLIPKPFVPSLTKQTMKNKPNSSEAVKEY